MKKFRKVRRMFRRSEYEIALIHYRKARRRGDVLDAQRWVKLADMHLRVADRFDTGVHTYLLRDAEREQFEVRAREQEGLRQSRAVRESLDKLMDDVDRRTREEWAAEEDEGV